MGEGMSERDELKELLANQSTDSVHIDDVINALLAAGWRKAAWQPIETAPKDASDILVCWSGSKTMAVASWNGDGWYEANDDVFYQSPPTHWMPLPGAPK